MFDSFPGLKAALKFGLLAAFLVAAGTLFLPNHYRSEARILPTEGKGMAAGLGNLASAAAAFGVSVPGSEGGDANFVEIIGSRWMGERLLGAEFVFKQRSWMFGAERTKKETLYSYIHKKNIDKAMVELETMINCSKDLKSKVISMSVDTKSPDLSQQVLQTSIRLLEQFVQEKGRTKGGAKAVFADARLKEAREEMAFAEDELRGYLEINRNFVTSSDPAVRLKGMRLEAELKLHQQVVMTLAMNREQALMEEKNDIPVINLLDPANLPVEKSKPSRSAFVIGAFSLVFAMVLAWANRLVLYALLKAD